MTFKPNVEWHYLGCWTGISLNDSLIWQGPEVCRRFQEEFGVWKGCANVFSDRCQTQHLFAPQKLYDDFRDKLKSNLEFELAHLRSRLTRFYALVEDYKQEVRTVAKKFGRSGPNADISTCLVSLRLLQHELALFDQFGIVAESFFLERANDILEVRNLSEVDRFQRFADLTAPWPSSTPQRERIALLQFVEDLMSSPSFTDSDFSSTPKSVRLFVAESGGNLLNSLVEEFGWIPVFLRNPSWNADHYIREAVSLILEEKESQKYFVRDLLSKEKRQAQLREASAREAEHTLQLNQSEKLVFDLFRLLIDTRNESEYLMGLASHVAAPIVKEVLNRLAIDVGTYNCLYFDEVVELLLGTAKITNIPVRERLEVAGYSYDQNHEFFEMSSEQAVAFLKDLTPNESIASEIIERRGICASAGTADGRVCVVKGLADFKKFSHGDILVAESTTVDFLPLMRRASGVITEHGGITCHAAIVARELGIPAIVGFCGATRLFTDGQRIRFNAIEGTVELRVG